MQITSDFSPFWILPILLLSIGISWWYYARKESVKDLTTGQKGTLLGLRSLALLSLGLLLLGITYLSKNYRTEKPTILVAIDDSQSMKNYKDSGVMKGQIQLLLNNLQEQFGEKFTIQPHLFGEQVTPMDSLQFKEEFTNISKAVIDLRDKYYANNVGAVVLISDGNFNQGSDPVYAAGSMKFTPFYTIGVGDTITKKDQFVKYIAANEVAFLGNEFPIVVDIQGSRMGKTSSKIRLFQGDKEIASQTINYTDGQLDFQQVTFLVKASGVGYQRYTVAIDPSPSEYNLPNNRRSIYIEVVDSRSKILVLANAPHPDMAAIKSVLDLDQNLEVESNLISEWDGKLDGVDLIVWHEPSKAQDSEKIQRILEHNSSKLFIIGPQADKTAVQKLNLGLSVPGSNKLDEVQSSINKGFQVFELSQNAKEAFQFFPPLTLDFGNYKTPAGADIFAFQRIGPVVKKEPSIFFGKWGKNKKYGIILGEGIWRWKMAEYARTKNFEAFNEIFGKIQQYLTVKENNSPLRISTPPRFAKNKEIVLGATFLDAAMNPITTPEIQFVLTDGSKKQSKFTFGKQSTNYKLSLGILSPGLYNWTATARHNGKLYSKSGNFVVKEMGLEKLDTRSNFNVLNELSKQTQGKFFPLSQSSALLNELQTRNDLTSMTYEESSFNNLIDWRWLLAIALFLLATEWFLRRWWGGY